MSAQEYTWKTPTEGKKHKREEVTISRIYLAYTGSSHCLLDFFYGGSGHKSVIWITQLADICH